MAPPVHADPEEEEVEEQPSDGEEEAPALEQEPAPERVPTPPPAPVVDPVAAPGQALQHEPAPEYVPPPGPALEREDPGLPTLEVGACELMASGSMDYSERYPLGPAIDQPNCRRLVQVYFPYAQAAQVKDPEGEMCYKVPAIHKWTGAYAVLTAPVMIGHVGLIFRDCPEYDPVAAEVPGTTGWTRGES